MYSWKIDNENRMMRGKFLLLEDGNVVSSAYATAFHADGRRIDTRLSELISCEEKDGGLVLVYEAKNGLRLTEILTVGYGGGIAKCALSEKDGKEVETRRLVPLAYDGGGRDGLQWWDSLFNKFLQVPYDNDFWLRYEAVPVHSGDVSYDVSVVFNEESREGLLVGALDFDVWKNAIVAAPFATRIMEARSGQADDGTHDSQPHGTLIGKCVESAPFFIKHGPDYRILLEEYGKVLGQVNPPMQWDEGVPFGFNAWAGLAGKMDNPHYELTANFLIDELTPQGFGEGVTYTNLDGGWARMDQDEMLRINKEIHDRGHKSGIYDGPFCHHLFPGMPTEIPGCPGHSFEEILLHDQHGDLLPAIDGSFPMDLTHPLWEKYTAYKLDNFIKWGYDYVKIDFLSHGGAEGVRYDKSVRTGRQALKRGYEFIQKYLAENCPRPFFISTSISPVFPAHYAHARRFCCDSFGTNEDIEYILNAQTYCWWLNGSVYAFNDPDHTVLYQSQWMKQPSSFGEARARYTATSIAGTVFLLSDDYENPEARKRTLELATNKEVNKVAASRVAFRPVDANGTSAAHAYTGVVDGEQYIALFTWMKGNNNVTVTCERAGIPCGIYKDLWTGAEFNAETGVLSWDSVDCDAVLLKKI